MKSFNSGEKIKKILVLTPAYSGGSWIYLEEVIGKILKDYKSAQVKVIGLGTIKPKNSAKYVRIRYPRFDKYGQYVCFNPILTLLWYTPLFVASFCSILFSRPDVVITNGFTPVVGLFLARKLFQFKIAVTHQVVGSFRAVGGLNPNILNLFTKTTDLVVANSDDCYHDVEKYFPAEKLLILKLWAPDIFFEGDVAKVRADQKLTICYVGRLDEQKRCKMLIDIAEKQRNNNNYHFIFVGLGEYEARVSELSKQTNNIEYRGYQSDRSVIKKIYSSSDLTWTFADINYLAFPAIESLACGTPIIVPNIAVTSDDKISYHLVPKSVGWIINHDKENETFDLLEKIRLEGISAKLRLSCRNFAQATYSSDNMDAPIQKIIQL